MFLLALNQRKTWAGSSSRAYWDYRPKIRIAFETNGYLVKIADTKREAVSAQKLRYQVFHKEYVGKRFPIGSDRDVFDRDADLLVVVDKANGKTVGTYRLVSSLFSEQFYSSSEFDLKEFLTLKGNKLELSRACIDKRYRNQMIVALLWKGIYLYAEKCRTDFIFGLGSIKVTSNREACALAASLKISNLLQSRYGIAPIDNYRLWPHLALGLNANIPTLDKSQLPPLLKSYLKAGAVICGDPAYDRAFNCLDLFTVLNFSDLGDRYRKRFG